MPGPEFLPSIDGLLARFQQEDTFQSRLVGVGIEEIYKSGNFASFPIPEGTTMGPRTINGLQIAANTGLGLSRLELVPNNSPEYQEMIERIMREQMDAFEPLVEITPDEVRDALWLAQHEDIRVLGAFQVGTLQADGKRTTEIIFPKAFASLTNSIAHAVSLSAGFLRYVQ